MDRRAFHGLAGEFADMLMPHTEADEAAVLAQFLVAFGNVIGRNPHYRVEADIHCANEFIVLVGPTAKGRKGTSWGPVREIVRSIDDEYVACRIKTGLSSGEGVIYQVREPAERDLGALDKRLLVYEPEFAGTLKVLAREGNTLSPVIRQAWDTGHLATLTKNNPLLAKDAHISIVTHITHDELKRRMSESEIFNGFANRFLWVCARRSKLLPEGGNFWQIDKADFVERLMAAVKFARFAGELRRDERASRAWVSAYEVLTRDEPGLLGAVLSRAEAHVLRLQVLYALLDQSEVVREEHLLAALAFWDYCDRSARYIFGDRTGDIIADRIYEALVASGDKGMSRNEIVDLFDRHVTKDRINVALDVLMAAGRAERTEDRQTGGRPVQRYHAKH